MPPLRERRQDIPLLTNYFIRKYAAKAGRRVLGISQQAEACLLNYDWPGNVRELENAIEHAIVLGSTDTVLAEDLPESVLEAMPSAGAPASQFMPPSERQKSRSSAFTDRTPGDRNE